MYNNSFITLPLKLCHEYNGDIIARACTAVRAHIDRNSCHRSFDSFITHDLPHYLYSSNPRETVDLQQQTAAMADQPILTRRISLYRWYLRHMEGVMGTDALTTAVREAYDALRWLATENPDVHCTAALADHKAWLLELFWLSKIKRFEALYHDCYRRLLDWGERASKTTPWLVQRKEIVHDWYDLAYMDRFVKELVRRSDPRYVVEYLPSLSEAMWQELHAIPADIKSAIDILCEGFVLQEPTPFTVP